MSKERLNGLALANINKYVLEYNGVKQKILTAFIKKI